MEVVVSAVVRYREPGRVRPLVLAFLLAVLAPGVMAAQTSNASGTAVAVVITGAGTGNGVVTATPGASRCVITNGTAAQNGCAVSIEQKTRLTLTPDPQFGSTFGGWGGACTGAPIVCTIDLAQASGVSARFLPPRSAGDVAHALMGDEVLLSPDERDELDRFGNKNGQFDVGDLLALLDRTGENLQPATVAALNAVMRREARPSSARRTP